MNPTLLISVACASLLFASKCSSEENQPRKANFTSATGLGTTPKISENTLQSEPGGARPTKTGSETSSTNGSIPDGSQNAATKRPRDAQTSLNSTSEGASHSDANSTVTLTPARNGASADRNGTTGYPVETSSSNASSMALPVTTPPSKKSTAHAQVEAASSPAVMTTRGASATSSGQASTIGPSANNTPAANAACPSRLSRAASLDVLVAALGALLWWGL
ncbi:uncharacterized protein LOC144120550 [Amblyomma americanum]